MIATFDKRVLYLSPTIDGSQHDYRLLKDHFPSEIPWFDYPIVLVDLGFQGILSDYQGDNILIPFKKPRKSKLNPDPQLSDDHKAFNQALAKVRVRVEHAIAGIKRLNIVSHTFRNRKTDFNDQVIAVSSALWNFSLA